MLDGIAGKTAGSIGGNLAAGAEGGAAYFLSLAFSPVGLAVMVVALAVALWKTRS